MTRINCGTPPSTLTNKHLIAEHRELVRIPNCVKKGRFNLDNIPDKFKLGTGHVKFFYNKLKYLHSRYVELYNECKSRGFKVTNFEDSFKDLPIELYNDYEPTFTDVQIITQRINERLGV